jgi:hypothetical protein
MLNAWIHQCKSAIVVGGMWKGVSRRLPYWCAVFPAPFPQTAVRNRCYLTCAQTFARHFIVRVTCPCSCAVFFFFCCCRKFVCPTCPKSCIKQSQINAVKYGWGFTCSRHAVLLFVNTSLVSMCAGGLGLQFVCIRVSLRTAVTNEPIHGAGILLLL